MLWLQEFKWQVKEPRTLSRPIDRSFDHPHQEHEHPAEGDAGYSYLEEPTNEEAYEQQHYAEQEYEQDESIVRSDVPAEREDELPPPDSAKSLLAKFRSMEDVSKPPPTPDKRTSTTTARSSTSRHSSGYGQPDGQAAVDIEYEREQPDGGYDPREPDVFEQYQGEAEAGEFENEPVRDPDIVRESDKTNEDLPGQGTTQNLLAKWQSMQASWASDYELGLRLSGAHEN